MTGYEAINRWAERWEAGRVRRWHRNRERTADYLTSWRNWPRQKALITTYFVCLLGFLAINVVSFWWKEALFLGLPLTVVLCVAWAMLRITIDGRDGAPEEVLDEYESKIINRWTRLSWSLLCVVCTLMTWALIFGGTTLGAREKNSSITPTVLSLPAGDFTYSLGFIFLTAFLAIIALPAIGYALHFGPRSAVEDDEFALSRNEQP